MLSRFLSGVLAGYCHAESVYCFSLNIFLGCSKNEPAMNQLYGKMHAMVNTSCYAAVVYMDPPTFF